MNEQLDDGETSGDERVSEPSRPEALELFAKRVGNELNNPLCAAFSALEYVRRRVEGTEELSGDPRVIHFLDILEAELATASRVSSDLVDFGSSQPVIRTSVVLRDMVQHALRSVRNPSLVAVDNRAADVLVHVDADKCESALRRIVENAIEAIPPERSGRVVIDGASDGRTVTITIKDDGVGLAPGMIARLGEPLFSTKIKGVGLGMAIAEAAIRAQSGAIEVTENEGVGTICVITVPSP